MSPRSGPRISGKAQNPDPWDLNRGPKGLRDRNSPTCTLSQNGYGTPLGGQMGPPNLGGSSSGNSISGPKNEKSQRVA